MNKTKKNISAVDINANKIENIKNKRIFQILIQKLGFSIVIYLH